MEKNCIPSTKAYPQGSVISPVLANFYLDEFDEELLKHGYKLVRYSDDFIVMCRSEKRAKDAMELTDEILGRMRLDLSDEKTSVTSFKEGFHFLGVTFLRDLIMTPFDRPKRNLNVVSKSPYLTREQYIHLKELKNDG